MQPRADLRPTSAPSSAKIDVPTLIVHGDRDVSAPLAITGRKTAALMPHATVKIYEGAPHGLFLRTPSG